MGGIGECVTYIILLMIFISQVRNFEGTEEKNVERKYALPGYKKFQIHFCARLDGIAHVRTDHLEVHVMYPDCLVGLVKWSKNIH